MALIVIFAMAIALEGAIALVLATPVWLLWNAVAPVLSLPQLTWLQAFALLALVRLLVGDFKVTFERR